MRNETESLHDSQNTKQEMDRHFVELGQIRESIELAKSDIRRTRHDIAQQMEEQASHVRRTRVLWVIAILLIGGIAALVWNSYELSGEYKSMIGAMPGLKATMDDVGKRVISAESKIGTWADENIRFTERMSRIENTVSSNLGSVRREARTVAQHKR
jgi:hypothetical protein